jgi:hypothetical protein
MKEFKEKKMPVRKFKKQPVVIEAIRFNGTTESAEEILKWIGVPAGDFLNDKAAAFYFCAAGSAFPLCGLDDHVLGIKTLEGVMAASPGDYVIKGVAGEFYPCKPEIFGQSYEAV